MQRELPMVGCVTRPMTVHTVAEMALVKSKADAAFMAIRLCGLDQQAIAAHMPMNPGAFSRMVNGRRPWSDKWQARFERVTGSFALTQWDCKARGAEFYADTRSIERAALMARLAEIDREAA